MLRSTTTIRLVIFVVATLWSPSTALETFDETIKQEKNLQNNQRDSGNYATQLRKKFGHDSAARRNTRFIRPGQSDLGIQENLDQVKLEHSSSSSLSTEPGGSQLEGQDISAVEVCQPINLNFAKAANGREMFGGVFVRGEWFHSYGLNIYAEGHDGKKNHHPMIFDSSNVESNGLVGNRDVFALGSPNFDCGGFGIGIGGKEGMSGENCQPLGNILIPTRKPGSPNFNLNTRARSYQPMPGGVLIFEFNKKTNVENIGFLNIEGSDQILAIRNDGSIEKIELVSAGQNGFQNVKLDIDDVKRLYITLQSFGAVTGLDLCVVGLT